jgi:hypothetical protein
MSLIENNWWNVENITLLKQPLQNEQSGRIRYTESIQISRPT